MKLGVDQTAAVKWKLILVVQQKSERKLAEVNTAAHSSNGYETRDTMEIGSA